MESNSTPIDFNQVPWKTATVSEHCRLNLTEIRLERTSDSIKIPTEKKGVGYTLYSPCEVIAVAPKGVLQVATGVVITKSLRCGWMIAYPVSPITNLVGLSPTVIVLDREIVLNFINADCTPVEIFSYTPIGILSFLPNIFIQPQSIEII